MNKYAFRVILGDDTIAIGQFIRAVEAYGPVSYLECIQRGEPLAGRDELGYIGGGHSSAQRDSIDFGGSVNHNHASLLRIYHASMLGNNFAAAAMRMNVISVNDWLWASTIPVALSWASLGELYCDNLDFSNPRTLVPESRLFEKMQSFNTINTFFGDIIRV